MPWELSFRGRSSQPPLRPRRHRDDKHPFVLLLVKIPWTIPHSLLGMKQRQSELAWQTAHRTNNADGLICAMDRVIIAKRNLEAAIEAERREILAILLASYPAAARRIMATASHKAT